MRFFSLLRYARILLNCLLRAIHTIRQLYRKHAEDDNEFDVNERHNALDILFDLMK